MEFLKRYWTQSRAQFGEMSFATRWLLGSLVVILLLVGTMLVYWGGSADMVPVDGVASGSPAEIVAALQADGIDAEIDGGQVLVPMDQRHEAVGSLTRTGHLDTNAYAAFDQLIAGGNKSWMLGKTEKDREYLLAKGAFLSAVIQKSFPNVDAAQVMIDKPEANGFGVSHIDPSASVMVTMHPGSKVSRSMADALIRMVSSSVAGLPDQEVTVTDTRQGNSFTAADPDDITATQNLEATLAAEKLHKQKLERVLGPWEGAIVAVKIVTSQVMREDLLKTEYGKPEISLSESEERSSSNISNAGEPGPRAMLGSSIDGSGGSGTEMSETRTTEQFTSSKPVMQSTQRIAGNEIRKINVSVVVPRSYYLRVYKAANPDAEDEPSDADLGPIIDAERKKIEAVVTPQIVSSDAAMQPGQISVEMVYDQAYLEPAVAGVGGGLGAVVGSEWTSKGIMAGLALMAVGMMLFMVKRATRQEDLPTIEELAGVPPTLPTDDDLMGEVDEMDGGLAGVELDEEELRARQIADQISDLVRANPEEASGLLTKWVAADQN